jgi:NSS family neurotransmitter:Na+ symporter
MGAGVIVIAAMTTYSSRLFLLADFMANDIFLILGALLMSLFVGWVWGIPEFAEAAGVQSRSARAMWSFLIRYLAPIVILVCWIAQLTTE